MNRLSPLIVRRAVVQGGRSPAFFAREPVSGLGAGEWLDDLKLFATGWVGGLVFFGTLLG